MDSDQLKTKVVELLDERKALEVISINVSEYSSVTDYMIVASGNSSRHVKSLTANIVEEAKQFGVRPLGVEGETVGEWALVDLGDVVVHIMQPQTREFYQLEKLWEIDAASESG